MADPEEMTLEQAKTIIRRVPREEIPAVGEDAEPGETVTQYKPRHPIEEKAIELVEGESPPGAAFSEMRDEET